EHRPDLRLEERHILGIRGGAADREPARQRREQEGQGHGSPSCHHANLDSYGGSLGWVCAARPRVAIDPGVRESRLAESARQSKPFSGAEAVARPAFQSSQLSGYWGSSSSSACLVNFKGRTVSIITASSSVRVIDRLAAMVPGCGPWGIPRGCRV